MRMFIIVFLEDRFQLSTMSKGKVQSDTQINF